MLCYVVLCWVGLCCVVLWVVLCCALLLLCVAQIRAREEDLESRRGQLQDSLAADMAAKKAAFLKETARAEQLLKARDFMKPYAAEVTAASVDQARSDFGCSHSSEIATPVHFLDLSWCPFSSCTFIQRGEGWLLMMMLVALAFA